MPGARALPNRPCALLLHCVVFVVVTMLLVGCARARDVSSANGAGGMPDLRVADRELSADPRAVTARGALDDLDVALYAFDSAYAGTYGGEGRPSDDAIAATRRVLAGRSAWPPADFARALRDLFRRADGHLSFGYDGEAPLRLFAVPPRPGSGSSERDRAPAVELRGGAVPILAIRSFDTAAESLLVTLPAIARRLRTAPQFVVDLRGNAGGNYAFAEPFALELTDRALRRLDEREVVSVSAAEGRANSVRRRLEQGDVPAAALPRFHAQLRALDGLAARLRTQNAPRADLVSAGATVRGRAPTPLRSRAVFLVDGGCASACEMLVSLVRQIPGVIIAGQSTRGAMAFGELALFRLPRSGVTVSMGTRAFSDPLGEFAETRGFSPDVWLAPESALADGERVALAAWESPRYAHRGASAPASSRLYFER